MQEKNPEDKTTRVRFTIWHLMLLMAAVALVYSLDQWLVISLMSAAVLVLVLAAPLLILPMLTKSRRVDRPAKVERAMIGFLRKTVVWSIVFIFFVTIAMVLKWLLIAATRG